jgi:hypothetical protein
MTASLVLPLFVLEVAGSVSIASAQPPGAFAPTGSLTTERTSHTAILLTNGKVLLAGGWATLSGTPVWASAELYDPSAKTFSATGSMTTPRTGHTATLLPDGTVLIAGGGATFDVGYGGSAQVSAELYDPSAGTFVASGSMTDGRSEHTATLLNTGQVLITGGYNYATAGIPNYLATAELYDPLTGRFTATGSMNAARAWHVATLLANGKVLIDGGAGDSEPGPEVYDPATGMFNVTGPAIFPRYLIPGSSTLLSDGEVLETLALPGDFDNHSEVYDPAAGTFSATVTMTTNRGYRTATLLPEGKVLIDGRDETNFGGSSELYDPVAGTFTRTVGMFQQSEEGHTATLLADGTVLLAGGWICCGFSVANAELYLPAGLTPSPVLYSLPGGTQGAIWNAATGQIASPDNPATAGDALSMYTTSLFEGGVIPPQVAIGRKLAEILFFGDAPGYPGYFQVNFRMPSGIAPGPTVPVRLTYLSRPSNAVTISVQ